VPVLDIGYVGTIKAVELEYHSFFESTASLLPFLIIRVPAEEVTHAVKFLRYPLFMLVIELRVLRKECSDWI
jgi:hypothetical protein